MRKRFTGIVLIALLCASIHSRALGQGGGRSYYLDTAGNDSNSGTSPAHPWRTLRMLDSIRLAPGDTVYLKRACVWHETLVPNGSGAPDNPITVTAYGEGSPPTISGADRVTGWSRGPSSVYKARLAHKPVNVYVDTASGWGLEPAASLGSMRPGSWYWDGGALFLKLADGSAPSSHVIEAAVRDRAVFAQNRSYLVIDSLKTERTACWAIEMLAQNASRNIGSTISNDVVTQNGTNLLDTGRYCNGIYVNYATAPTVRGNTVSYAGGHNGINVQNATDVRILDNDVSHWNHNGIDTKMSVGVLYQGNRAHDSPHGNGIYSEVSSNITVDHNLIYNIGGATNGNSNGIHIGYRTGGRIVIAHNTIRNTFGGIYLRTPADAEDNAIQTRSGNTMTNRIGNN